MEKELLQKIYNLKNIKPDSGFVKDVKENIVLLQQQEAKTHSIVTFFKTPVVQNNNLVLAGGLLFLIVFGVFTVPFMPTYKESVNLAELELNPRKIVVKEGETEVAEGDSVEVATTNSIEKRFTVAENNVRSITRQVLGTIISEKENTQDTDVTDKEIAFYIYEGLQKQTTQDQNTEGAVGIMSVPTEKTKTTEREDIKKAMNIYKEGNYEEFIHTIFDLLETQELLDILAE